MRRPRNLRDVLKITRKQNAKLYGGDYRLTRQPKLKVLPGTKTFYDEAKAFLEAAGFVRLGDYRLTSMPRGTPANLTPIRVYFSPDRETVADAYYFQAPIEQHMASAMSGLAMPLTYDFTTEFSDGGFLATSNAEAASMIELPRSILSVFHPAYTPAKKILAAHRKELARQRKLGRQPRRITTEAEWKASAERMHRIKSEFRESIGHGRMTEIKAVKRRQDTTQAAVAQALGELFKAFEEVAAPARRRKRAR